MEWNQLGVDDRMVHIIRQSPQQNILKSLIRMFGDWEVSDGPALQLRSWKCQKCIGDLEGKENILEIYNLLPKEQKYIPHSKPCFMYWDIWEDYNFLFWKTYFMP